MSRYAPENGPSKMKVMISSMARLPSGWTVTWTYAEGRENDFAAASPAARRASRTAAARTAALRR
jgi:hypothetical protein